MRLDLLATLAGLLIAIQSRANGELSVRIDNSLQAALVSFGSGLIIVALVALFHPGIRQGARRLRAAVQSGAIPRWRLFGGVIGGVFVAVQTQIVPLIGVAIYSVAMISGQTAASLIVDRLGMTGGGEKKISRRRVIAALLTVLAVLVSVWDRIDAKNLSLFAVFMGIIAGFLTGVQRALNGQVNEQSQQSFTTSFLNFITGTTLLVTLLVVGLITHKTHISGLHFTPWWMYLGGITGVIYIAFSSTVVQHLGVLSFTLFSVGGQLVGSLLIDLVSPTKGVHVGGFLVAGILLTYVGVFVNNEKSVNRHRT
ncbi:MAG: DMT family transporter [Actinomycetota bacterium]